MPFGAKTRPAFTLIELLVVIALIAILAAMLFPVFAQVREKGRTAVCLSHAHQIGLAMRLYAEDYDDLLLPGWIQSGRPPDLRSQDPFARRADLLVWTQLLQPYLKNYQVFYCPSFNETRLRTNRADPRCAVPGFPGPWPARFYYAHFGIALAPIRGLCTPDAPRIALPGNSPNQLPMQRRLAQVVRPSETAFIQDNFTAQAEAGGVGISFGCECSLNGWHQGGCTYIFVDGHAQLFHGNLERTPTIPCPGASIGSTSYPDCVCAKYLTWDY